MMTSYHTLQWALIDRSPRHDSSKIVDTRTECRTDNGGIELSQPQTEMTNGNDNKESDKTHT